MSAKANLDIRVEIAPDAQPDGDPNDWTWLDISSYRRQKADIEIEYGRGDESSEVEAGSAACMFNLRDGLLSPRNPYSALYGRIGPNTPIRFRLPIVVDTFSRTLPAGQWGTTDSGGTWAVGSAWSVSGGAGKVSLALANQATIGYLTDVGALDTDTTYSVSLPAVMTGAGWYSSLRVRHLDDQNNYRVQTQLQPAGVVTIKLVRVQNGSDTTVIEDLSTSATYSAGTKVWTRVVADGGFLRAKVWSGVKADEPAAWNIWSTLVRIESGGIGMHQWRLAGNTNVGTVVASIDDFTVDALLWSGNVPEWPPRWDRSGNDSVIGLTAAGPFRRLLQGDDPIKSPLTRQLPRYSPAAGFPGEEGSDALTLGSVIPGHPAARTRGVSFGQDDSPAGASKAFKIDADTSSIQGQIPGNTTGSFAGLFFVKFPALPAADTIVMEWRSKSGSFRRWVIRANATGWQLKVYDADGDLALDGGTVLYVDAPTEWTAVQLETSQVGGNVNWALIWNRLDRNLFYATSGSLAGTSQRLSEFYVPGSVGMTDALLSQVWAFTEALPFVDATFFEVSRGYAGELASDRIERLCAEEGVLLTTLIGDSEPMGRQRADKFLPLLREAASADVGVLYERAGAVAYNPRGSRYNQPVTLALDWAGGDLKEAPQPTDDDQRLRNRWVVSRTGGSEATYSNAASIARFGAVGDSAEINIESDSRLPLHASWRTALTTVDELRWPTIELDLIAHPELQYPFLSCRIGSRITIANPKDQVAGTEIDLIIEGVKQTIGRNKWDVTLTCSPAKPWKVATWNGGDRYGAATTTVQADSAPGSTLIVITTVDPLEKWSTTASGYRWNLGGEVVLVTAMSAATGSGPYVQTATVTRAQNGVSKTIKAGTRVAMAAPARWAL